MPKSIGTESRNYVRKLYEYFERELQNGGPLQPLNRVAERVAEALGISKRTITRILKEKYGDEETSLTSIDSANDSDDEYLIPKQSKVFAHKGEQIVNCITKDNVNKQQDKPVSENEYPDPAHMLKTTKTDYKRHAYFAVEHSETATEVKRQFTKTKLQKSAKSKKCKLSKQMSVSGSRNTKTKAQEPALQNEMSLASPNVRNSFTNMDESIDLDALSAPVDPILLEKQNTVKTDELIPLKEVKHIDKSVSYTYLDEDEIDCFKIVKHQKEPEVHVDKQFSSKLKLPVAQKMQNSSINANLGTVQKSIAKADFKVGRLKVSGITHENETDESEEENINHPVPQINKPSPSNKINLVAIHKHVKGYHKQSQVPTIKTLLISLNKAGLFSGSKDTLLKIMADIGFKFNFKVKKKL